eukprot:5666772-Pleurochrysis_carterae.AAC.2
MACLHWYRLITSRPTTVYTDNTVAASIASNFKCPRPPATPKVGDRFRIIPPLSADSIPDGVADRCG